MVQHSSFPFSEREPKSLLPTTEPGDQRRLNDPKTTATAEEKTSSPKKSLLNTSYSSEEILFQAASSLQGLEGSVTSFDTLNAYDGSIYSWLIFRSRAGDNTFI